MIMGIKSQEGTALLTSDFSLMAQQPLLGQDLLIIDASPSHSDTHAHSVGLFWTSDQSDEETSTWQHTTLTTEIFMYPVGFEPTIQANRRQHTHALDRAATGIGTNQW